MTTPFMLKSTLHLESLEEEGCFSGYASVFDYVDEQKDRVMPGAFQKSLKDTEKMPKMLWQHNVQEPIGIWKVVREDARGLYVEGRLLLDLQRGREAYTLLKKGIVTGLSIGCQVVEAAYCHQECVRELKEVSLMEISLVTFAANQHAKVLAVKSSKAAQEYQNCLLESIQNAIRVLREI